MIEDSIRKMIRDEVHKTLVGCEREERPAYRIELASLTVLAEDIRMLMECIERGTLSRDERVGLLHEINDLEHAVNECRVVVMTGLIER